MMSRLDARGSSPALPSRRLASLPCACLLLLQFWPVVGASQAYKWVDHEGRVHYGDAKPRGLESRAVEAPPRPSPEEVSRAERRLDEMLSRDTENDDLPEHDAQEIQNALQEERTRQAECRFARKDLGLLEMKRPVYRLDDTGNRVYLDDEQRAADIAGARHRIAQHCR